MTRIITSAVIAVGLLTTASGSQAASGINILKVLSAEQARAAAEDAQAAARQSRQAKTQQKPKQQTSKPLVLDGIKGVDR
jgi:hypothetical protein